MQILQKIEEAVSGVLDALHGQGLKESSIRQISWSVYRPIINWHYVHLLPERLKASPRIDWDMLSEINTTEEVPHEED